MKYAMLINDLENPFEELDEHDVAQLLKEYVEVANAPGVYDGARLRPVWSATTVRVVDGDVQLTDGPFTEAKEYLGGFLLVDVSDLDAAIALAQRIPAARMGGSVEIRPLFEPTR